MICLDSNAVIAALSGRQSTVRPRIVRALADGLPVAMPTVVMFELWTGIRQSRRAEANAVLLDAFFSLGVERWSFETEDAMEAGDIRAGLERAGTPIGPYDVLIAAQARRRRAVLVTSNVREFRRVPGLVTEDWTLPT